MAERRAWSVISVDRFREYLLEAQRLIDVAKVAKVSPFAAALAGVSFIHNAIGVMGGSVDWWIELLRDPETIAKYAADAEAGGRPAPGPAGKQ